MPSDIFLRINGSLDFEGIKMIFIDFPPVLQPQFLLRASYFEYFFDQSREMKSGIWPAKTEIDRRGTDLIFMKHS